jgi:hypothetical protein
VQRRRGEPGHEPAEVASCLGQLRGQ